MESEHAPDTQIQTDTLFEEEEAPFEDAAEPRQKRLSDAELETLYDTGTAHIVTQRNDFLIPNLIQSMEEARYINLNPPYQRRLRWDNKRKAKLIESLLMNVPIPPVFLFETDLAQYEVMDGQQRLSTIREFFNNEFALSGLEKWSALNGRRYNQLPTRIQSGLRRRSLSAIILLAESGFSPESHSMIGQPEIKRFVFERLNTGGVSLNPQEVRNAVYDGPFNRLLHELSRDRLFTDIWDIPPRERAEESRASGRLRANRLYRQMLDCEIILRFFALQDESLLATSMKASLDKAMETLNSRSREELEVLRNDFIRSLQLAFGIYGPETFRLPRRAGARLSRGVLSRALYDAVMIGLHKTIANALHNGLRTVVDELLEQRSGIVARTQELFAKDDTYELLTGRFNTRQSIIDRIDLMRGVFEASLKAA